MSKIVTPIVFEDDQLTRATLDLFITGERCQPEPTLLCELLL